MKIRPDSQKDGMGRNGAVAGVHVYAVPNDGELAYGALLNSHHREFEDVMPRSAADATRAAVMRMRNNRARMR